VRVAVDGRSLVGGGGRGVAHYTSALLRALAAAFPGDEWRVVVPRGAVAAVPDGVSLVRSPLPSRVLFGAAALSGRPRLDRLAGGCDAVWAPAPAPLAVSRGVPLVVTVHDRSWEERPGDFTAYERTWHRLARPRALARRAARVVTTTEHGRRDVVVAWGLDPARVVAVPPAPVVVPGARASGAAAASAPAAPAATTRADAMGSYFLFVGALEPRKAPEVLAVAAAIARGRGLAARVVVVGDGRVAVPGLARAGRVDDAALSALYAGALALVVPSRLEGFGLPAVEALAHGTPVIATGLAPVREVLGDAATYVPVDDPEALAAAMVDAEAHPRRADPGAVAHLSWTRAAQATRAALAEAAGA